MASTTLNSRPTTLYQHTNDDGLIHIIQTASMRSLYFGNDTKQSEVDMLMPHRLALRYTQAMMSALLFNPSPQQVLMIGLGAGSMVHFLWHYFPDVHIDAVEQRADVAHLAVTYFALPIDTRINIIINDGLNFLQETDKQYDLILVDAFTHEGIATDVQERMFFAACQRRLTPEAILSVNLWDHPSQKYMHTLANIHTIFQQQTLSLEVEDRGNVVILASNSKLPKQLKSLQPRAKILSDQLDLNFLKHLRHLKSPGYLFRLLTWAHST